MVRSRQGGGPGESTGGHDGRQDAKAAFRGRMSMPGPRWTLPSVPDLAFQTFDVHELIGDVATRFAAPAQSRRAWRWRSRRRPRYRNSALGEVDWLHEVMCGLIDNAVRFTDSGEVVASVTTDRTERQPRDVPRRGIRHRLRHGRRRLARLFGPRRGARFTPTDDGAGSLRVVHRLVELMDGRLGCSSAVGMGTTTWFSVPLDLPGRPRRSAERLWNSAWPGPRSRNVLTAPVRSSLANSSPASRRIASSAASTPAGDVAPDDVLGHRVGARRAARRASAPARATAARSRRRRRRG